MFSKLPSLVFILLLCACMEDPPVPNDASAPDAGASVTATEPFCDMAHVFPVMDSACAKVEGDFVTGADGGDSCLVSGKRYSCLTITGETYFSGTWTVTDHVSNVGGCLLCDGLAEVVISTGPDTILYYAK